ncbi:MAG: DUF4347 domain-containing protein, partial [Nitrospira sp.]|nr:DUF4347 domain-containing protein [Nitrospira sp.]
MSYLNSKPVGAKELFVIDGALPDVQSLIDSIGAEKWIFVLEPARDGVNQLADFLGDEFGLSAIHILSHGSAGRLNLGTAVLEQSSIPNYLDTLQTIGKALTDTGDLLLYGCNVAEGDVGQAFIAQLAGVTGADIAASMDFTGTKALGGNWTLESATGDLEATSLTLQDAPMLLADDYYDLSNGKLWSFLADCSLAAYSDNASLGENLLGLSSWQSIEISSLPGDVYNPNTGRYQYGSDGAFVAYSDETRTAVISFEGTSSVYDWQHDISGMFPSVVNLVPLIDAFDTFVRENKIKKVYVTGHSLGGALAQAYMMCHIDDPVGPSYEAVTFAAPGFNFGFGGLPVDFLGNIPNDSKMKNMPNTVFGMDHDNRVLHFEISGDVVPDLLVKIGDTIHIECQGEGSNLVWLHSMWLYSTVVKMLDNAVPEDNFPQNPDDIGVLINTTGNGPLTDYVPPGTLYYPSQYEFIVGGDSADALGDDGGNRMYGEGGDDSFYVEDAGDRVIESDGEGVDTVYSYITYRLEDHVERLTLQPDGAFAWFDKNINGTGNDLNNVITGNNGNNTLTGNAGNDTLSGLEGKDSLFGGPGQDTLIAIDGTDTLEGGTDSDTYDVSRVTNYVGEVP